MSLPIVLRDDARLEFDQAVDWYDQQRKGLGHEFLSAVQRTFDLIAANPDIYAVVFADVRRKIVRRFPYCVFYRPHADRIEVIAVFHTSRDPLVWQRRV